VPGDDATTAGIASGVTGRVRKSSVGDTNTGAPGASVTVRAVAILALATVT